MRKTRVISLLLCFILAACNLPTGEKQSTITPPPDQVETQVRLLLTAQPSPTAKPVQPSNTAVAFKTPDQPAATELPPATETPRGETSTAVPSVTISPEDLRAGLGQPTWKSTFDTGKGFGLNAPYEDDNSRFAVENGMLVLSGLKANGWHGWRLTSPKVLDFYLEATALTGNCSGSDIYGLVTRAPDFDSGRGYYYGITCDGRYSFGKWEDSGIVDLINMTQNSAILAGPNQTNRIGIKLQGSKITLYANGKLLQEIEDDSFGEAGNFGVWIAANRTAGFTVNIDEMNYWKLQ